MLTYKSFGAQQVLQKVAELPLVCHAVRIVLARNWSPVVVVVSPDSAERVRQVFLLAQDSILSQSSHYLRIEK